MAGMSVSLDGNNIQLSFQKDNQSTAVVLDIEVARSLISALGQLLTAIDEQDEFDPIEIGEDGDEGDGENAADMVDITSPTIDIGLDDNGHAIMTFQAGPYPPLLVRLQDDEARHIAQSLMEILNSPHDIRLSGGGH